MTHYTMQVKVFEDGQYTWKDVRPSGGKLPYTYATKREALNMLNMCYPMQVYNEEVRVKEHSE